MFEQAKIEVVMQLKLAQAFTHNITLVNVNQATGNEKMLELSYSKHVNGLVVHEWSKQVDQGAWVTNDK